MHTDIPDSCPPGWWKLKSNLGKGRRRAQQIDPQVGAQQAGIHPKAQHVRIRTARREGTADKLDGIGSAARRAHCCQKAIRTPMAAGVISKRGRTSAGQMAGPADSIVLKPAIAQNLRPGPNYQQQYNRNRQPPQAGRTKLVGFTRSPGAKYSHYISIVPKRIVTVAQFQGQSDNKPRWPR